MEIKEYRDTAASIGLKPEDWANPIEMIRLALCELARREAEARSVVVEGYFKDDDEDSIPVTVTIRRAEKAKGDTNV